MQIDFEVEIDTNSDVSVEVDDSVVWEAVEDSVDERAREAVQEYAWDAVQYDVENAIMEGINEHEGESTPDVDDSVERLLNEYNRRVRGELSLCSFGESFRTAIELTTNREMAVADQSLEAHAVKERVEKLEATLRDLGSVLRANTEPF